MAVNDPNVGLAMGLTVAAGAATAVGAAVVFVPRLVKLASRRMLAGALGLSAGVMTYVSFVEIFSKSRTKFVEAGYPDDLAYAYATACFFGGVVFMTILNFIVSALLGRHHHHHHGPHDDDDGPHSHDHNMRSTQSSVPTTDHTGGGDDAQHQPQASSKQQVPTPQGGGGEEKHVAGTAAAVAPCACCSDDPVGDLEAVQRMAQEMEERSALITAPSPPAVGGTANRPTTATAAATTTTTTTTFGSEEKTEEVAGAAAAAAVSLASGRGRGGGGGFSSELPDEENLVSSATTADNNAEAAEAEEANRRKQLESQKLMRMSINTALAIGLHNFPEGLATFLSTLADPSVGIVLAIAIAIHNIPEGICVAMPVYYATGSRWKAFGWAVLSGLSEPFAALLGWVVLASVFSDALYATLFGVVAGMMVIISTRELMPTAHRYDPEDSVVTYSFMVGMAIMALSLVLFLL